MVWNNTPIAHAAGGAGPEEAKVPGSNHAKEDSSRCEKHLQASLNSPVVRYMIWHLESAGCHIPGVKAISAGNVMVSGGGGDGHTAVEKQGNKEDEKKSLSEKFFQCKPCHSTDIIGAFSFGTSYQVKEGMEDVLLSISNDSNHQKPHLVICSDNVEKFQLSQDHVQRTVVHELIHAYDQCRIQFDWKNCRHIACTEIRAANLSSDCDVSTEFNRNQIKFGGFSGHGKTCTKRRAILSLKQHSICASKAEEIVDEVFEACFADTAPFVKKF